ncbi:uncharacterized protein [Mobula birostris]|uniref:uncharacterized protein isoform X2 n=1 Tax=Mobula birostris TaxID=1983395 RepID=UPI003B28474A
MTQPWLTREVKANIKAKERAYHSARISGKLEDWKAFNYQQEATKKAIKEGEKTSSTSYTKYWRNSAGQAASTEAATQLGNTLESTRKNIEHPTHEKRTDCANGKRYKNHEEKGSQNRSEAHHWSPASMQNMTRLQLLFVFCGRGPDGVRDLQLHSDCGFSCCWVRALEIWDLQVRLGRRAPSGSGPVDNPLSRWCRQQRRCGRLKHRDSSARCCGKVALESGELEYRSAADCDIGTMMK